MVINGIVSFVSKQCNIKRPYELHDTNLVIDGHSLQSILYRQSSELNRDYLFGCDYRTLAENVCKLFRRLRICNVTPVIVFDGLICPGRYKCCFNRRIIEIKDIAKDYLSCRNQSATLTNYVFVSVAKDFGMTVMQTSTDPINEMARLANKLKCPVLSDKSDFLVLNLDYGVIQFEMLRWIRKPLKYKASDNYWYLTCKHFHIDHLLAKYLGLRKEVLPLFATIMENDYFSADVFEEVFKESKDSIWNKKWKPLYDYIRHKNMDILLDWLRGKDMDKAIEQLRNHLNQENVEEAVNELKRSMKKYEIANCEPIATSFAILPDMHSKMLAKGDNECVLPNWFLQEYHCGVLRPAMMNIIVMKTHVLYPQIEDFSLQSSYCCTLNLRRFLYAILRTENDRLTPIKVMDRKGLDGVETYEVPLQHTLDGQYVPMLQEVRQLDIKQRYELLMKVLGISQSYLLKVRHSLRLYEWCDKGDVVESTTFLIVVLKHLITTESDADWSVFSSAVIACILFYSYQFLQTNPNLQSLCDPPKFRNETHSYNPKFVHSFAQFQACLHVINFINAILEFPLKEGRPYYCLDGIFIYNISAELSKVDDPNNYLNKLLRSWPVFCLHQRLLQLVLNVPSLCCKKL